MITNIVKLAPGVRVTVEATTDELPFYIDAPKSQMLGGNPGAMRMAVTKEGIFIQRQDALGAWTSL